MLLVPYAIRKDELLGQIARRYKISLRELLQYNPQIRNPDHVWAGTMIKIPIDNSIGPGDQSAARDLRPPIVGPYVRTPDGSIIRLPHHIRLAYYGSANITQAVANSAWVTGTRGVGYQVIMSLGEGSHSGGSHAAKEVGEHGVIEAGVKKGVLPETAGFWGILFSVLNPKTTAGQTQFVVTADNGTMAVVRLLYPAD